MSSLPSANQKSGLTHLSEAQRSRKEHREWIAGSVATLLSHYYRHDDPGMLTSAIARDWVNVLEPLSRGAIEKARIDFMRQIEVKRPTPNVIYALARKYEPVKKPASRRPDWLDEPPRKRMSPEDAMAIVKAAGFAPKRIEPVRKHSEGEA